MSVTPSSSSHVSERDITNMARQVMYSGQLYQVVLTCINLNIFDILSEAGGPISPSDIATRLKSTNPTQMINRLLQLLAIYDIVSSSSSNDEEEKMNMYGPTPLSNMFLNNNESSLAGIIHYNSNAAYNKSWAYMKDAILDGGIPFDLANGMSFYQYLDADPEFHQLFFKGLTSRNKMATINMVETYNGFQGLSSLVDVGGAHGFALNKIISKYPSIKGINYDLPHIIAVAPSYPGIEHVMGDMFVSIPKAEAIFLKAILHNWDDEDCVKLLKNCYNAIPESGKVIVAERLCLENPENSRLESKFIFHLDCVMLSLHKGRERTEKEFRQLGITAGFQSFKLHACSPDLYIMELLKINT